MTSVHFTFARELVEGAGYPDSELITAFNIVQIAGLVLLLAVLLTAWLSPAVSRSFAWYNIIISSIFSALSFLLIMGQQTGPEPPFGVCLFQSMLIYAVPSLNACVCLGFALDLFFSVQFTSHPQGALKWRLLIILLPHIIACLVILEVLVLGLTRPHTVRRAIIGMYCHLTISTPSKITSGLVVFATISILPVAGVTVYRVVKNWTAFQQLSVREPDGVPPRMVIRFGIFCLLPLPIVTIALVSVNSRDGGKNAASIAVATATLPFFAALIFGTQTDILTCWMIWRRNSTRQQAHMVTQANEVYPDVKGPYSVQLPSASGLCVCGQ